MEIAIVKTKEIGITVRNWEMMDSKDGSDFDNHYDGWIFSTMPRTTVN